MTAATAAMAVTGATDAKDSLMSSLTMRDGTQLHVADYSPLRAAVDAADISNHAGAASADGTASAAGISSPTDAVGSVVILHGLGEHAGRHAHVARFFAARGYAVRTYDHRGHGRSGGARGDVPDADTLLADARAVIADWLAQPGTPATPPILLGHSMGGLFAAKLATEAGLPVSALVLSSPALGLFLNPAQKLLLKLLHTLAPGLAVSNGLKARYLSQDRVVVDAYLADPLVHDRISARLLSAMLAAIDGAQQGAHMISVPVLLLVSGSDRLVDAQGSRDFHAQLATGLGQLIEYPSLYHELFNETEASTVFADLEHWLSALQARIAA